MTTSALKGYARNPETNRDAYVLDVGESVADWAEGAWHDTAYVHRFGTTTLLVDTVRLAAVRKYLAETQLAETWSLSTDYANRFRHERRNAALFLVALADLDGLDPRWDDDENEVDALLANTPEDFES